MNETLQSELWKGLIPIEFVMDISDIATNVVVDSHYLLASRYSYLYEISQETIAYFQTKAIEISSLIWYECQGVELKHYLPVGVLYDMYDFENRNLSSNQNQEFHPWKIIIHFQKPSKALLTVISANETQRVYFHTIKQSLHQLYGSTSDFNLLTIENQNQLWKAVNSGNLEQFRLLQSILAPEKQTIRQIPVRIFIDGIVRQKLVRPSRSSTSSSVSASASSSEITIETGNQETNEEQNLLQYMLIEDFQVVNLVDYLIVIQGIVIEQLLVPLVSFYLHMRYSDFYLYILLIKKKS
jgi:hypothetical protein